MITEQAILNERYAAACEARRPFITLQPHTRIFIDGNQWCILYGENLQDGVAGFGDSPEYASWDFDKNWCAAPPAQEAPAAPPSKLEAEFAAIHTEIKASVTPDATPETDMETHEAGDYTRTAHVVRAILAKSLECQRNALRRRLAEAERDAKRYRWLPIDTAPHDNKRPLLLARFNDDGTLQNVDYDGTWQSDRESWEMPEVYWFWASACGNVEEPSHWMYQPDWYAAIDAAMSEREGS